MILDGIDLAPADIQQTRVSLEQVSNRLRHSGDARAIFPDLYLVLTRVVEREVVCDTGFFLEPAYINGLVAEFARRYLETLVWTLEGRAQDSYAWALAYDHCRAGTVTPFQHGGLGISAHINFDMALGINATLRRLGYADDPARLARCKHDHDAANELIARSLPLGMQRLEQAYGCSMTALLGARTRGFASRHVLSALRRWRERVWTDSLALLHAPDERRRHRVVQRMQRRSRRIGQALGALHATYAVLRVCASWGDVLGKSLGRFGAAPDYTLSRRDTATTVLHIRRSQDTRSMTMTTRAEFVDEGSMNHNETVLSDEGSFNHNETALLDEGTFNHNEIVLAGARILWANHSETVLAEAGNFWVVNHNESALVG